MPTPDPNNVLFKIAHPDLYERNPFNVLNLPVTATAKDIRRRKEDIEAAFDAGTEADEFAETLPRKLSHEPPTRSEVESMFESLENPEERLAWELFWFWEMPPIALPADNNGRIIGNPNGRFTKELFFEWTTIEKESRMGLLNEDEADFLDATVHNLAIAYHMSSLSGDWRRVRKRATEVSKRRDTIWKIAIGYWNRTISSDGFWNELSARIADWADPRIDDKTIARFREQVPFALGRINAELAVELARIGHEADAKRQISYMRCLRSGTGNVESSLEEALSKTIRQIDVIVETALAETRKDPKTGAGQVRELMNRTEEPLRILRAVFTTNNPIRNSAVESVFNVARTCLIAYGNETEDYEGSLEIVNRLVSLAEAIDQKVLLMNDSRFLTEAKTGKELMETCWNCKKKLGPDEKDIVKELPFWGNMIAGDSFGQVKFQTFPVRVHLCRKCDMLLGIDFGNHPGVKKALSEGWNSGEGPTQDDIAKFWGVPSQHPPRQASSGCLIPLAVGLILAFSMAAKAVTVAGKAMNLHQGFPF